MRTARDPQPRSTPAGRAGSQVTRPGRVRAATTAVERALDPCCSARPTPAVQRGGPGADRVSGVGGPPRQHGPARRGPGGTAADQLRTSCGPSPSGETPIRSGTGQPDLRRNKLCSVLSRADPVESVPELHVCRWQALGGDGRFRTSCGLGADRAGFERTATPRMPGVEVCCDSTSCPFGDHRWRFAALGTGSSRSACSSVMTGHLGRGTTQPPNQRATPRDRVRSNHHQRCEQPTTGGPATTHHPAQQRPGHRGHPRRLDPGGPR